MKFSVHPLREGEPRLVSLFKPALTAVSLLGLALLSGCGKPAETVAEPVRESTPSPAPSKPSLVVQPPVNAPANPETPPAAMRVVYVVTAFQAMNSDGTHDIPVGAAVNVLAEEGDEYQIEFQGISVRTPKAYFSERLIQADTIPLTPPPESAPGDLPAPAISAEPTPALADTMPGQPLEPPAAATPDPAMAADEKKATELIGEIRSLNDQIRLATDQMEVAPATNKAPDAAKIEKLKKRRDQLSENLTEVAKP